MTCHNQPNLPDRLTGKQDHHMVVSKHKIHSFKHTSSNSMEQSVRIRSITYRCHCQVPFAYKKSDAIKGALLDIRFLHPYTVHPTHPPPPHFKTISFCGDTVLTRSLVRWCKLNVNGRWLLNLHRISIGYKPLTEIRVQTLFLTKCGHIPQWNLCNMPKNVLGLIFLLHRDWNRTI